MENSMELIYVIFGSFITISLSYMLFQIGEFFKSASRTADQAAKTLSQLDLVIAQIERTTEKANETVEAVNEMIIEPVRGVGNILSSLTSITSMFSKKK